MSRDRPPTWFYFLQSAVYAFNATFLLWALFVVATRSDTVVTYSSEYFRLCVIGGVISALPHVAILPLDIVKCQVQGGTCGSASEAYANLKAQAYSLPPSAPWWRRQVNALSVFFWGWQPTLMGYCSQGALKFGLYEILKYNFASEFDYDFVVSQKVLFFLCCSATAEMVADCTLAPWETVKVAMQTGQVGQDTMDVVVPRIAQQRGGWQGFFKCLLPLMFRQVPMTMIKFALFEKTVEYLYHTIVPGPVAGPHGAHEVGVLWKLLVAVLAGYMSGFVSAVASCPADTLVSRLASREAKTLREALDQVGFAGLFASVDVRIAMVGTYTSIQYLLYESFKVSVGLPATSSKS